MEPRSYRQYCGLAKALDLVGERWTLLIVRNLLLGSQRYSELLHGLPGITTNLLAKRLKGMEVLGLIERVRTSAADASHTYRLTPLGGELEPAVHALGSWGWHWMSGPQPNEFRNIEFLLVALRRRYLGGLIIDVELIADEVPYRIVLRDQKADISRGAVPRPDLRITGTGTDLMKLFLTQRAPAKLRVEGAKFQKFMKAFRVGDGP